MMTGIRALALRINNIRIKKADLLVYTRRIRSCADRRRIFDGRFSPKCP